MDNQQTPSNADNLKYALDFLKAVFHARCELYFDGEQKTDLPKLSYYDDGSAFGGFIEEHKPTFDEYVVLLLALVPHISPAYFDSLLRDVLPEAGDYPEIGGRRDADSRTFTPSGETAAFLLSGDLMERRFQVQRLFHGDHWFAKSGVLYLDHVQPGEPHLSGRIMLDQDLVELFTVGEISSPRFSMQFPAQEISTDLNWEDLVLGQGVRDQIQGISHWVKHNEELLNDWQMRKRLRPGYKALFYGPPGTGKTLTATLLGNHTQKRVFRVDLSTVTSKYIGETEKNLASLFDRAQNRNWILFFDEADALFGKRTDVKDSHDRYANQEASYLLQRVEEFDGLIILASNLKSNMDDAFLRRFNSVVRFPFPSREERQAIWLSIFPSKAQYENDADFSELFAGYELTGGSIVNVVHTACLMALAREKDNTILVDDVNHAIKLEMEKEGKVFKPAA
jgi:AAA+ superfamily predicted ATPase